MALDLPPCRRQWFWPVTIARGPYPFPSRTRSSSLCARMVLHGRLCGRVRRCRPILSKAPDAFWRRGLSCILLGGILAMARGHGGTGHGQRPGGGHVYGHRERAGTIDHGYGHGKRHGHGRIPVSGRDCDVRGFHVPVTVPVPLPVVVLRDRTRSRKRARSRDTGNGRAAGTCTGHRERARTIDHGYGHGKGNGHVELRAGFLFPAVTGALGFSRARDRASAPARGRVTRPYPFPYTCPFPAVAVMQPRRNPVCWLPT